MARPYRGGALTPHSVPAGELTNITLGQWVGVYDVYQRGILRSGEVVYFIEAGKVPDPAAMDTLFGRQKLATALKQYPTPTRASKYRRLIIKNRSGNCYCFTMNPNTTRFYPANLKDL